MYKHRCGQVIRPFCSWLKQVLWTRRKFRLKSLGCQLIMEHCKLYINETRVVNKLLLVSIIQPLQNHQKTCEDGGLCAVADVRGVEDQQERGWSLVVLLCCRSPCQIHKVEDAHIVVFLSGKQQSRTRERHPAASGSAYRLGQGVKLKWAVALQWDDSAKVNFLECSKTSVWLTWNLWCSSFFPPV